MSKEGTESARLLELHEAHVRAWNEFDLGALGAIYDPGCYIFDTIPPPVFRSLNDFLQHVTPALQSFNAFTLRTFDHLVRVDERRDDRIGWIASRYEIEARRGEGVHRRCGRWTEIYEKRGNEWKLVHLHSSDDPEQG
ncbi:MAG: nuclear transport factor 2 family protein [Gemmatimonadota bacterium]|nr:MAG: nuclear transport factor 2 family protein [Gemmatimonadota bacterium]